MLGLPLGRRGRRGGAFCGAGAALALVRRGVVSFGLGVDVVQGESMRPAFCPGDIVIYNRLAKEYAPGDVVVFAYGGGDVVKRVAALAGDRVELGTEGEVLVNGEALGGSAGEVEQAVKTPLTVPEGSVFLLGDNPAASLDSRYKEMGPVEARTVLGKAVLVVRRLG